MSTLRVNTFANAAGTQSTAAENVINGCAKAWVNFNGTGTVSIRASYNVSSITDNGTGEYTVNFTNAFADTNYCISGWARNEQSDGFLRGVMASANGSKTTSAIRVSTALYNSFRDVPEVGMSIFR